MPAGLESAAASAWVHFRITDRALSVPTILCDDVQVAIILRLTPLLPVHIKNRNSITFHRCFPCVAHLRLAVNPLFPPRVRWASYTLYGVLRCRRSFSRSCLRLIGTSVFFCFGSGISFGLAFLMRQPGIFFRLFGVGYLLWREPSHPIAIVAKPAIVLRPGIGLGSQRLGAPIAGLHGDAHHPRAGSG
jgi:hypothetical protein